MMPIVENYETDHDFRTAVAAKQIWNEGKEVTTKEVAARTGFYKQKARSHLNTLRNYRILKEEDNRFYPGSEFKNYYNFYNKRYSAPMGV